MNILLATDVFPPKSGGSGWSTYYLGRALASRGHQVEIAQPVRGFEGRRAREYGGLRVTEVGYIASTAPGARAARRARAIASAFGAYLAERAGEVDVVHAQHLLTIPAAVEALAPRGVPVVATVRDYWPVCLYGTLWRDGGICPVCRDGEITRCLKQRYGPAAALMRPLVPFVERELRRRQRALGGAQAVVAVSCYVAGTLRAHVAADRLHVIPNLIDAEETARQASISHSHAPAGDYLLFVGKLNELKGADVLGEVLEKSGVRLPLVVAGDGPLVGRLGQIPGVELRGWISNAETLGLLAGAAALLFPARWAEPLARTLLEAQALGVPTLALNTGGTRDIIDNNVNGLLAANVDEFATLLRRLAADKALREQLAANARRIAVERFSPDVVVGQMESLYRAVAHP